jgi:hypothetical protein
MRKHKAYFGQCDYHYGKPIYGLRIVQLTPNGKEWQQPIAICKGCRKHLKGSFRYPSGHVCPGFLGLY